MTTRAKLNLASLTSSVMILMNVFSRPLGISDGMQWTLIIGMFIPLGLIFHYNKKVKDERVSDTLSAGIPARGLSAAQKKIKNRFIVIWICFAAHSLTAPVWLPITGVSLGVRRDFLIGVATAIVVSVIFAVRLKKMQNQTPEPTAPSGHGSS